MVLAVPTLRPYQASAIDRLRDAVEASNGRVILTAPTGAGKTTIAGRLMELAVGRGSHVLFIAHREELIAQASGRLADFGLLHGIIKAGHRPDPGQPIQVASIQTLVRRALPPADLVIVDEGHRAISPSYRAIFDAYPGADIVALTATPVRTDGRGLGDVFGALVEVAKVSELIAMGFLMRTRVLAPSTPDLVGIRTVAGDFDPKTLALRVERPNLLGSIVDHWGQHARGARAVLFAANVQHSQNLVASLQGAGARAAHIDGDTDADTRAKTLAALRAGDLDVVSNVGILTEGYDLPDLGAVILARPTQSLALHLQMIGRVMRPAQGKTQALVLDHAGNVHRHGFAETDRTWTLSTTRAKRSTQTAVAPVKTCPTCFLVVAANARSCPACGSTLQAAASAGPRQRDGRLEELTAVEIAAKQQRKDTWELKRYLEPWLRIRTEAHYRIKADGRPYSEGWAKFKFKDQFGRYPSKVLLGAWSEAQAPDLAARFGIDTSSRAALEA